VNPRLRIALAVLVVLVAANIGWRIWSNWGLITIDADNAPVTDVTRRIAKQAHIQLVTNAPDDAKVTMHVHKVTLTRALEVLAINTNASWSVGYFTAPNKAAIRTALATFASGDSMDGWKKFAFAAPPMGGGGFGGVGGASDSRRDRWEPGPADHLQPFLEQAALAVSAQFWAPTDWNPSVAKPPAAGAVRDVVGKLAGAAGGASEEVFLLTLRGQPGPPVTANGGAPAANGPRPADGGFGGGPPSAEMRAALEKRTLAEIDKLPADKRKVAREEFERRKKFFEEIASLPEDERRQKIHDAMERAMNSGEMESRMTQFDAMHTAEQRANFFRMVLKHKAEAAAK
jgi:hypothetical protein